MPETGAADSQCEDHASHSQESPIAYDITTSPNDFNVLTICSFLDSGAICIPGFQRNFVWDIGRASRLIESLILGLPVPQIFLYEQDRDRFVVIDGQQRLLSIYYFSKNRFPRKDKLAEIRRILNENGAIPGDVLGDDRLFHDFALQLPRHSPRRTDDLAGLIYPTLGVFKSDLDLRPIRNMVVKQNVPGNGDAAIFEIFARLNSGGVHLKPQEIRASMYHSNFYTMLSNINAGEGKWRRLLQMEEPDLHLRDIEFLLRGFAMLADYTEYTPSMTRFLNRFSRKSTGNSDAMNSYLKELFASFLGACQSLPEDAFIRNNRFSVALYEAIFAASLRNAFAERRLANGSLAPEEILNLANDEEFKKASMNGTMQKSNVELRLSRL